MSRKAVQRPEVINEKAIQTAPSNAPQAKPASPSQALFLIELAVCAAITLAAIILHVRFILNAGGLWRDEIHAVNLGLAPSISEFWQWLETDTFPAGWHMTIRAWATIFGSSDGALRILGALLGLAIIALVWWNARQLGRGLPLIAMALFAVNPVAIVFGDSLRGYGLGTVTMLFMCVAVAQLVVDPTWRRFAVGLLASVVAVQSFYFNPLILVAMARGAAAVSIRRRAWKPIAAVIGVGAIAAVTLLPYMDPLTRQSKWNAIRASFATLPGLLQQLYDAVISNGGIMIWIWSAAMVIAFILLIYQLVRGRPDQTPEKKDREIFVAIVLLFAPLFYCGFIYVSGFPSRPWYYVALMAVVAVFTDAAINLAISANSAGRIVRIIAALVIAGVALPGGWEKSRVRLTNVRSGRGRNGKNRRAARSRSHLALVVAGRNVCALLPRPYSVYDAARIKRSADSAI